MRTNNLHRLLTAVVTLVTMAGSAAAVGISPAYRAYLEQTGDTATLHRLTERFARQGAAPRRAPAATATATVTNPAQGVNLAPHGLVILVQFADLSFQDANNHAAFDSLFNSDSYTYGGAYGSVRQYFRDQSNGQYNPQFDVIGPVTLSHNQAYYGENEKTSWNDGDKNVDQFIKEACTLAAASVDYSLYDNDKDGKVDFVYFIYAGQGEADGGADYTIWPHNYCYSYYGNGNLRFNGKTIDNYACSNELSQTYNLFGRPSGLVRNGVGTPCHEFSHVCGLPDLYNTSSGDGVLGTWDILDGGSYNGNSIGNCPAGYSAYEKFYCGWISPTTLRDSCSVEMATLTNGGRAYIINSTGTTITDGSNPSPSDFFILENRQKQGWDRYLPGHGMLVMRIRYNANRWTMNSVNNYTQKGVSIVTPDGSAVNGNGKQANVFPTSTITGFTPFASYPLYNIAETSGIIRFDFMRNYSTALPATSGSHCAGKYLSNGQVYIQSGAYRFTPTGHRL